MAKYHDRNRIAYCPACYKYIPEDEVALLWSVEKREQEHVVCGSVGVVYRNAKEVQEMNSIVEKIYARETKENESIKKRIGNIKDKIEEAQDE